MFNFTNFPRGRDLLSSPSLIAVFALAAIFFTFSATKIVIRERAIASERGRLEEKIAKLRADKEVLEKMTMSLSSKEAVERTAKEKLNLKNSGEEVVIVAPTAAFAPAYGSGDNFFMKFAPDWFLQLFNFLRR